MTDTDKKINNSTALKFSYSSLAVFVIGFALCFANELLGGCGLVISCLIGLISVVLGLVEKNPKAWGLGLIPVMLFAFFAIVGSNMA